MKIQLNFQSYIGMFLVLKNWMNHLVKAEKYNMYNDMQIIIRDGY